jgi:hypothetical protein
MSEIFNIIPKHTDTCLHFRFRYFFRMQSFASAISDFAMAYVDWIAMQVYKYSLDLLQWLLQRVNQVLDLASLRV